MIPWRSRTGVSETITTEDPLLALAVTKNKAQAGLLNLRPLGVHGEITTLSGIDDYCQGFHCPG